MKKITLAFIFLVTNLLYVWLHTQTFTLNKFFSFKEFILYSASNIIADLFFKLFRFCDECLKLQLSSTSVKTLLKFCLDDKHFSALLVGIDKSLITCSINHQSSTFTALDTFYKLISQITRKGEIGNYFRENSKIVNVTRKMFSLKIKIKINML